MLEVLNDYPISYIITALIVIFVLWQVYCYFALGVSKESVTVAMTPEHDKPSSDYNLTNVIKKLYIKQSNILNTLSSY